jgi:hypothetical protein
MKSPGGKIEASFEAGRESVSAAYQLGLAMGGDAATPLVEYQPFTVLQDNSRKLGFCLSENRIKISCLRIPY